MAVVIRQSCTLTSARRRRLPRAPWRTRRPTPWEMSVASPRPGSATGPTVVIRSGRPGTRPLEERRRAPRTLRVVRMQRRIYGVETEFGVTCTFHGQRRLSPDEVARYLFRRVVSWGRSSNVFLRNGARLYLDVGSHPEYATPECDHVRQLVVHDKAGERIIEGLVADAQDRLAEEGIEGEIYVFKN